MHLLDIMTFGYKVGVDPTVPDFYEAIVAASRAATTSLAARLRYRTFDRYGLRKDYFQPPRMFGSLSTPHVMFSLSRGFVDGETATVRYAGSLLALKNGDASQYYNLRDLADDGQSDRTLISNERGIVAVEGVDLSDKWVEVAYTGGLYVASDDAYEDVPGWLSELAMACASINLMQNRALVPENAPDLTPTQKEIADFTNMHGRFHPHCLKPFASSPGP